MGCVEGVWCVILVCVRKSSCVIVSIVSKLIVMCVRVWCLVVLCVCLWVCVVCRKFSVVVEML